jgi:hypothetical protein
VRGRPDQAQLDVAYSCDVFGYFDFVFFVFSPSSSSLFSLFFFFFSPFFLLHELVSPRPYQLPAVKMTGLLKVMVGTSLVAAYLLASRREAASTRLSFAADFAAAYLTQFLFWTIWQVILYPKLFSPLRGLPEPKDNHPLMGQFGKITREPTGAPMTEWYVHASEPSTRATSFPTPCLSS